MRTIPVKPDPEDANRPEDESPLKRFEQGIRSKSTRDLYTGMLRRVLCEVMADVLDGGFEARAAQLLRRAKNDPDRTLALLLGLAGKLRELTELPKDNPNYLNPASVSGSVVQKVSLQASHARPECPPDGYT